MRVRGTTTPPSIADVSGGPSLRAQFKATEKALADSERKALDALPPEQRAALKAEFTQARAERAQRYAAMLCSVDGWQPKPGAAAEGKVLTGFYGLVGERARALAKREGKPLSPEHVERVRLSKADIVKLRETYGDAEVKKAWPLLQKHIAHDRFLDANALKFMQSGEFLVYHAALQHARDTVDRNIATHREKLSAADAELLRDHLKQVERRLTWTEDVVVERRAPATAGDKTHTQKYVSVGGRLVPLASDTEVSTGSSAGADEHVTRGRRS